MTSTDNTTRERLTTEELESRLESLPWRFDAGERVVHVDSSDEYVIVRRGFQEKTLEPIYVYAPAGNPNIIWTRPMEEFHNRFESVDNTETPSPDSGRWLSTPVTRASKFRRGDLLQPPPDNPYGDPNNRYLVVAGIPAMAVERTPGKMTILSPAAYKMLNYDRGGGEPVRIWASQVQGWALVGTVKVFFRDDSMQRPLHVVRKIS